jgi:hypothetical protein
MARQVDFSDLSDDDLHYLHQRPWLLDEAERTGENDGSARKAVQQFAAGLSDGSDEVEGFVDVTEIAGHDKEPEVEADNYDEWTNAQLAEELEKRDLAHSGNKAELIERLRENDSADA